jgi:hypothetical protein
MDRHENNPRRTFLKSTAAVAGGALAAGAQAHGGARRSARRARVRSRQSRELSVDARPRRTTSTRERDKESAAVGFDATPVSTARLAAEMWQVMKNEKWALPVSDRIPWARRLWPVTEQYQMLGSTGAAGVGGGAPIAVGAAFATLAERSVTRVAELLHVHALAALGVAGRRAERLRGLRRRAAAHCGDHQRAQHGSHGSPPLCSHGYCGTMPAVFMTDAQRSYSALRCAVNSSGVLGHTSSPSLSSIPAFSGWFAICTISLFSRAMIAGGVCAGTTKPYQLFDS